jgi:hypothetical protein
MYDETIIGYLMSVASFEVLVVNRSRDSAVGTATGYGLDD